MNRRKLITGLISFIAAPAIVRAHNLMPVKVLVPEGWAPIRPEPKWQVLHPDLYQDLLINLQQAIDQKPILFYRQVGRYQ